MVITTAITMSLALLGKPSDFVGYQKFGHGRAYYHAVTADLSSGLLSPEAAASKRLTSIWTIIGQEQPLAAITGTFFHMGSGRPVGDVLVDGALVATGYRGSAIGVSYFGDVRIFDTPFRRAIDWGEYRFGLRGTIRVVSNGSVQPNPKAQKFRDSRLWGRASRTGIGLTHQGKLVMIATTNSVTLSELGKAMKSLGVVDGISLDGGGSTALYYRGKLLIPPKRKLCNLFVLKPAAIANWSGTDVQGSR